MATSQPSGVSDRMQVIGLVLIGLIFAGWLAYSSYTSQQSATKLAQQRADSLKVARQVAAQTAQKQSANPAVQPSASATPSSVSQTAATTQGQTQQSRYGALFESFVRGNRTLFTIQTPLFQAQYNSHGAVVREWQLKKYNSWFGEPVQLVPYSNSKGVLGIGFTTHEGKEVDTRDLFFAVASSKPAAQDGVISLQGSDSVVITARLTLANGAAVIKTITFYADRYDIGLDIALPGMDNVIANRRYELSWKDGIQYQEENSVNESTAAKAVVSLNRNLEELDASEVGNAVQTNASGTIDYAAIKTQYFMAAIQPKQLVGDPSVYLDGSRSNAPDGGAIEHYTMTFRLPYNNSGKADHFTTYIGPLDYDIVKQYGMEGTVEFGYRFLIRPIAEYILLPFLQFIHSFIPNYGWAIIVFAIVLRVLMQPLMASQLKSSQKMQLLAPEIEKIKTKFKDDQQRQQQETMSLYAEYGINPAGGCLPLLLQMPIFFALSQTLSTITLRQSPFALWIHDLSVPDVIVKLPFKVPLLNVDVLSGLALLMAITILIQSMITVTDPNQKAMMYVMPVMMVFFFSGMASGVGLYYMVFNLLGIGQQLYVTKFARNKLTLADLKKMPKKEGWIQRKMREAQEIAASQGRSVPGQQPTNNGKSGQLAPKKKK